MELERGLDAGCGVVSWLNAIPVPLRTRVLARRRLSLDDRQGSVPCCSSILDRSKGGLRLGKLRQTALEFTQPVLQWARGRFKRQAIRLRLQERSLRLGRLQAVFIKERQPVEPAGQVEPARANGRAVDFPEKQAGCQTRTHLRLDRLDWWMRQTAGLEIGRTLTTAAATG